RKVARAEPLDGLRNAPQDRTRQVRAGADISPGGKVPLERRLLGRIDRVLLDLVGELGAAEREARIEIGPVAGVHDLLDGRQVCLYRPPRVAQEVERCRPELVGCIGHRPSIRVSLLTVNTRSSRPYSARLKRDPAEEHDGCGKPADGDGAPSVE